MARETARDTTDMCQREPYLCNRPYS
ncbi:MAG: hypothetical protein J07HR59_01004, partial [Halorubrum sp. J07HR59]